MSSSDYGRLLAATAGRGSGETRGHRPPRTTVRGDRRNRPAIRAQRRSPPPPARRAQAAATRRRRIAAEAPQFIEQGLGARPLQLVIVSWSSPGRRSRPARACRLGLVHVDEVRRRPRPAQALVERPQLAQRAGPRQENITKPSTARARSSPGEQRRRIHHGVQHHVGPDELRAAGQRVAIAQHDRRQRCPAPRRPPGGMSAASLRERSASVGSTAMRRSQWVGLGHSSSAPAPSQLHQSITCTGCSRMMASRSAMRRATSRCSHGASAGARQAAQGGMHRRGSRPRADRSVAGGSLMGGQYIEPVSLASLLGSLPGQCSICRDWGRGALCKACRERYAATRPRCGRCAIAVPPGRPCAASACASRRPSSTPSPRLDYDAPWSSLIARFKFHGGVELAPLFAELLREAVRGQPVPDLLLPAPLSEARLRERGFNQSWEIARRLGRVPMHACCCASAIRRIRSICRSTGGLRTVREAFAVEPLRRAELAGRSVVLVDDVMTTGATAAEMARTLLRAGASRVQLWVLARTPPGPTAPEIAARDTAGTITAPCSISCSSTRRSRRTPANVIRLPPTPAVRCISSSRWAFRWTTSCWCAPGSTTTSTPACAATPRGRR